MPTKRSATAQRELDALALRLKGHTFEAIAEELGFANKASAHKAYRRALVATTNELQTLDEQRLVELARLDALTVAVFGAAEKGDLAALDRYIKITDRRARLAGLYVAGRRTDDPPAGATTSDGVVVARDRLDELRERRAGT